jgi:hypothetical protein
MTAHSCPSWPCPLCFPNYTVHPPHYPLNYPHYGYTTTTATPRGCICPPGAEKTCQGFGCPRKPIIASGIAASGTEARSGETEGLDPQGDGPTSEAGDAQL